MTEKGKISEISGKFDWQIQDFFSITEESYRSPVFHVSDSSWYIAIRIKKTPTKSKRKRRRNDQNYQNYVSLSLVREANETPVDAYFRFGIKTVNNAIAFKASGIHFTYGQGWGWAEFVETSQLLQNRTVLVPSGTLTITCFLMVKSTEPDLDLSRRDLAENLKSLFISKENSDVKLYIKRRTILAHRIILSARSPVFAAMFRNDTVEKTTGVVKIVDSDLDAFKVFLSFLYSGEVDFSKCNVCELYKIAHKYYVPILKSMCVNFLLENISVDNFFEIFLFGQDYMQDSFQAHVQNFFNKNFEKIVSSKSWEHFLKKNYRFANTMLKEMAPKINLLK